MAETQNTRINETLAEVIKPAYVRELARFSQTTGYSLSPILNRAVKQWLEIEAPVYLEYAKRKA